MNLRRFLGKVLLFVLTSGAILLPMFLLFHVCLRSTP